MTLNSPAQITCLSTPALSSTGRRFLAEDGTNIGWSLLAHDEVGLHPGLSATAARRLNALSIGSVRACSNYSYRLWDVAGNGWGGSSLLIKNSTSSFGISITLASGSGSTGSMCLVDGVYHIYCDGNGSSPSQNGWTFDNLFTGQCPSSPAFFLAFGGVSTQVSTPTGVPTPTPTALPTARSDTFTAGFDVLEVLDATQPSYLFYLNVSTGAGVKTSVDLNVSGYVAEMPAKVSKDDNPSVSGPSESSDGNYWYGFQYKNQNVYLYLVSGLSQSSPAAPASYDLFCKAAFSSVLRSPAYREERNVTAAIASLDEAAPVTTFASPRSISGPETSHHRICEVTLATLWRSTARFL